MKSNQERNNECLPPKKREILALEERHVLVASTVNETQSSENLAWLASVASMANMAPVPNLVPSQSKSTGACSPAPLTKALTIVTEYPPSTSNSSLSSYTSSTPAGSLPGTAITANPAILSSTLPQAAGPIQPNHLPSNLQIIGPYTSYFSSQVVPAAGTPTQSCRPTQEVYATTAVIPQALNGNPQKQHVISSLPTVAHTTSQCIQVDGTPVGLPVISPASQVPIQLHTHSTVLAPHGLTLAPSQVLVHYADGLITKPPESQCRDLQDGALGEVTVVKHTASIVKGMANKPESDRQRQIQSLALPTQTQVLLPADYAAHDGAGLQTSVMLVSSNHLMANNSTELQSTQEKKNTSLAYVDRTRLSVGQSVSRVSSLSLPSSDSMVTSLAPTLTTHSLLHTSPSASTQELSANLFSSTQLPIIGYITSTSGPPQQAVASYHSNLPQHLVISGSPSLLIPVTAGNINTSSTESDVTRCFMPSISATNIPSGSTGLPQAYITSASPTVTTSILPNGKEITGPKDHHAAAGVESPRQVPLPLHSSAGVEPPSAPVLPPTPTSPQNSPPFPLSALPPYFMKGSIIQLADGELKRVEDLKTEDFLQSAEVSTELTIDSSTVERIYLSRTPDAVMIHFSVGEHKAQVCVEVLVEYPFFVFGQGWSSCCPDRTTQLLALSCAKLSVGDVCISLTLKSLRNGALQKDQTFSPLKNLENTYHKPVKTNQQTGEPEEDQRDFGIEREHRFESLAVNSSGYDVIMSTNAEGKTSCAGSRKRRWSAPERGEIDKSQENEHTMSLPKPPFLSHKLKVSIEGRSSMGI